MTKVKLKDAIKDLTTDAAKVRDDASRVRQSADGLAKSLRALENGFIKSLNAKAEQEKRAEEEKRLSDHSKAYVMLDVDEQAAVNAARQEAEKAEKAETEICITQPLPCRFRNMPSPDRVPKNSGYSSN